MQGAALTTDDGMHALLTGLTCRNCVARLFEHFIAQELLALFDHFICASQIYGTDIGLIDPLQLSVCISAPSGHRQKIEMLNKPVTCSFRICRAIHEPADLCALTGHISDPDNRLGTGGASLGLICASID